MDTKYLLNFKDLIEVYDDGLDGSLENISWSTDSDNGKVEVCRCTKYQKQDPEFVVFKDQVIMGGNHYYILPGSVDLFKSVFPNGVVGNPFINFNKDDKFKRFSDRLNKCFSDTKLSTFIWLDGSGKVHEDQFDLDKYTKIASTKYRIDPSELCDYDITCHYVHEFYPRHRLMPFVKILKDGDNKEDVIKELKKRYNKKS